MDPFNRDIEQNAGDDPENELAGNRLQSALRVATLTLIAGSAIAVTAVFFAVSRGDSTEDGAPPRSPEPLAALADVETPEPAAQMLDAQERVRTLEEQLATAEAQLVEVAAAAGVKPEELGAVDLAVEVSSLRANLIAARQVRDRLRTDLTAALAAVDDQVLQTDRAKSVATSWKKANSRSQWHAFAAESKVALCDHGTRKKVDQCQAQVDAYFTEARFARYAECVEGGHATPVLLGTEKGAGVPAMAEPLTGKQLPRNYAWYVLYCDPVLPERDERVIDTTQLVTVE